MLYLREASRSLILGKGPIDTESERFGWFLTSLGKAGSGAAESDGADSKVEFFQIYLRESKVVFFRFALTG